MKSLPNSFKVGFTNSFDFFKNHSVRFVNEPKERPYSNHNKRNPNKSQSLKESLDNQKNLRKENTLETKQRIKVTPDYVYNLLSQIYSHDQIMLLLNDKEKFKQIQTSFQQKLDENAALAERANIAASKSAPHAPSNVNTNSNPNLNPAPSPIFHSNSNSILPAKEVPNPEQINPKVPEKDLHETQKQDTDINLINMDNLEKHDVNIDAVLPETDSKTSIASQIHNDTKNQTEITSTPENNENTDINDPPPDHPITEHTSISSPKKKKNRKISNSTHETGNSNKKRNTTGNNKSDETPKISPSTSESENAKRKSTHRSMNPRIKMNRRYASWAEIMGYGQWGYAAAKRPRIIEKPRAALENGIQKLENERENSLEFNKKFSILQCLQVVTNNLDELSGTHKKEISKKDATQNTKISQLKEYKHELHNIQTNKKAFLSIPTPSIYMLTNKKRCSLQHIEISNAISKIDRWMISAICTSCIIFDRILLRESLKAQVPFLFNSINSIASYIWDEYQIAFKTPATKHHGPHSKKGNRKPIQPTTTNQTDEDGNKLYSLKQLFELNCISEKDDLSYECEIRNIYFSNDLSIQLNFNDLVNYYQRIKGNNILCDTAHESI